MSPMPRCCRTLPAGLLPIWFLAGIWLLPAQAQLHELPPSTPAPQTLPYDTNPKGRTLGSSALPSDPYGGPSRSGRADAASQLRDPYVLSSPERTAPGLYPPGTTSSAEPAGPGATQRFFDANTAASQPLYYGYGCCWTWQLLPDGLMYKSYLAGGKEPRFGTEWVYQRGHGWVWDAALGGRVGVLRLGTQNDFWPEGWQLDFEGATFPRLDLVPEHDRDLISADFRVGVPLTSRRGPWEGKFGYYHISAHLGDEFMLTHPGVERVKYVRDSLLLGIALRPHPDWRLYWETACAFNTDGGAKPWEFQFGAEYSETEPTGASGAPFIAANGHLRQENNFSGNFVLQTGWQWRGRGGHLVRVGAHYFNGFSDQYQFFKQREDQIGVGMWYDF